MNRRSVFFSLMAAWLCLATAVAQDVDTDAHTKIGDKMPAIVVEQAAGGNFSLAEARGKVVLLNFWATWCGPCQLEMPELEKQVWQKYRSRPDFVFLAIAREQDRETVLKFQKKHENLTFPLAWDPTRAAYGKLASAGIPRCYVIDRNGTIVYQTVGYGPGAVEGVERAIDKALARP